MNRYAFFLILSMLLVGSNVGIGKSIVVVVPVAILATLRFVIAIAVLWPLWRPSKMRTVKRDEWLNLFLQALFGTFLFTLLMLNGVQRTSAVAAGVITSTIPAVVALFAWIFLRERPDGRALLSIALAIVGVVAINLANGHAPGAESAAGSSLTGNLLILGAVCCESIYVILSRRLTQTLAPLDICAYTHLFGLLLMLPLGLLARAAFRLRERAGRHLGARGLVRAVGQHLLVLAVDDGHPPRAGQPRRRVQRGAADRGGRVRHRLPRRAAHARARHRAGLRGDRHRAGEPEAARHAHRRVLNREAGRSAARAPGPLGRSGARARTGAHRADAP